ncbi:hypothetical protein GDO86_015396 [Hymenochirus boettgeri]|uniref:Uncharacterized protein n=1 Tax=Hymenochirus boettgeri TaxID=247094 RepID=A0A8T2JX84_9PIPI|nr:hypothetical protein GDO86_015396 [Hymenochirus boettgeri]
MTISLTFVPAPQYKLIADIIVVPNFLLYRVKPIALCKYVLLPLHMHTTTCSFHFTHAAFNYMVFLFLFYRYHQYRIINKTVNKSFKYVLQ